jgi:type IV pilus assembly protein PilY1
VVDAFWGGAWHTVLAGTLGAGGRAVFALDVTDPNDFTEANASTIALWEIDETSDLDGDTVLEYADLGYTYSQPAIIKAEGHGWVAVFGNGYDSANGKAVLYIARIYDGALLAKIDLSTVDATAHDVDTSNPVPNGLSTVSPIDTDGDGDVDLIYGGDLNGNVWRFAATAGVGFGSSTTSLLFTAKNVTGDRQPITSRFAVGRHPISAVGRILYFGTGKYFELDDQDPTNAVLYNTMYGIWDRDIADSNPSSSLKTIPSVTTRNSNTLQQQEIELEQSATFGSNTFDVRTISKNPVTWVTRDTSGNWNSCSSSGSCGWYLDLESTGEKMVANPILRGGRLIFVTTIPSLVACEAGGTGWLLEIDPNTGGRLDEIVFDLNGDGVFDFNDNLDTGGGGDTVYTPVSGKKSKVGILQPPAILSGIGGSGDGSYGGVEGKYSSGSKDAQIDVTIENPGILGAGRKSWVRIK